jgi:hypothetical protein
VTKTLNFKSKGGDPFTLFEKSPAGDNLDDAYYLYEEVVGPQLKTGDSWPSSFSLS